MHERIPTSPTSEELDTALARILSEPSWAHRLLCAAATVIEREHPHFTMTYSVLTDALNQGKDQALAGLPDVVVHEATMTAMSAVPAVRGSETLAEYALRLRASAGSV